VGEGGEQQQLERGVFFSWRVKGREGGGEGGGRGGSREEERKGRRGGKGSDGVMRGGSMRFAFPQKQH